MLIVADWLPVHHGGLHEGAVAHHHHLRHCQFLQCHVCLHAGGQCSYYVPLMHFEPCGQAPFYPREAVSKGLKVWHFGLVFGAFEITVFLVSPIIGASIKKIGVKVGKKAFNMYIYTILL